jgi:hypothetical protein
MKMFIGIASSGLALALFAASAGGAHAFKFGTTKPANMTMVNPSQYNPSTPGCEVKWGVARCPAGCKYVSGKCVKER